MAAASGVPSFRPLRHPIRPGDRAAYEERQGYAADDPENEEHDARGAEGRAGEVEHVPVEGVEEHAGPEEQADERSTTGEPQRAEQEETGVGFGHTEGVGRVGSVEARRSRAGGLRRRP